MYYIGIIKIFFFNESLLWDVRLSFLDLYVVRSDVPESAYILRLSLDIIGLDFVKYKNEIQTELMAEYYGSFTLEL